MTRKTWYLILGIFGALVPWNYFSSRDWTLGCISLQFWDFCNISLFPRIPSLQSFGNLWNSSYIKLLILYIRFHFTWGVNGTCTNTLQNFKILWRGLQLLLQQQHCYTLEWHIVTSRVIPVTHRSILQTGNLHLSCSRATLQIFS